MGQHQLRLHPPALEHARAGRVIVQGALLRDESRGAHYKPDFPDRNDEKFLKTTKASFTDAAEGPRFEFEDVDTQYIKPRPRRYDAAK